MNIKGGFTRYDGWKYEQNDEASAKDAAGNG